VSNQYKCDFCSEIYQSVGMGKYSKCDGVIFKKHP